MFEGILKKRDERDQVLNIPIVKISPNPAQPRRVFDKRALEELAHSISTHGIIQPLVVLKAPGGYELVAGERRLRAAIIAGFDTVPCVVKSIEKEKSALYALVENMQRCDLGVFEEAEGISRLIGEYGMTQEQAARMLSKSQSAISNKLRLLRLSPEERRLVVEAGLTERHARALLRLSGKPEFAKAVLNITAEDMNVESAETYIKYLAGDEEENRQEQEKARPKIVTIIKDVRIFMNTINHAVSVAKQSGLDASIETIKEGENTRIVIILPTDKTR